VQRFQRPIAVVIVGGLLTSTLVTLIFLPLLLLPLGGNPGGGGEIDGARAAEQPNARFALRSFRMNVGPIFGIATQPIKLGDQIHSQKTV
jgi:hypothetical protein